MDGTRCLTVADNATAFGGGVDAAFERFAQNTKTAFADPHSFELARVDQAADRVIADIENFRRLTAGVQPTRHRHGGT
jgi:hypothetical protein